MKINYGRPELYHSDLPCVSFSYNGGWIPESLCHQKRFYTPYPIIQTFPMGIHENINMLPIHPAASVLSRIDHPVNHYTASIGDDSRVYGDGAAGGGDGAGAGSATPSGGAGTAGTVSGCLEGSKRNEAAV